MNRIAVVGVVMGMALQAAPAFAEGPAGAQITNCGVATAFSGPPTRAIVYNTPAIENLLALGLEDNIYGIIVNVEEQPSDAPWDAAKADLNRLTEGWELLSEEALLALEPDFVYAAFHWYLHSDETATRETLTSFGIPSYLSPAECAGQQTEAAGKLSFDSIFAELRDLADIFDVEERGEALISTLTTRIDNALTDVDSSKSPSMLWYYAGTDAPYVAGCCGAPGILTEAVGGTNIYADDPALWPIGNWEVIVDRDPDVIVIGDLNRTGDGQTAADKIAFLESDPLTSALTAVRNKNYIIIPGREMDPSARNVLALERLVSGLAEVKLD